MTRDVVSVRVIEDEMKDAYMAYAMSVIVGRALPDVRDGLKPVHRRILYAMHDLGMRHNTPYKKSARIVGEVLGKYHPHGDSAVYDALVRLAQEWNMSSPLIDGQGNFGSQDGDSAAAMRYTEARLAKISQELLLDLEKDTVDWSDNFDGSLREPSVLPSILPNLLVNGSAGIAVGMATNMPPHNISEVVQALIAYIKNSDISLTEILSLLPGPDFPTGGTICGRSGIYDAYSTGRGKIKLRGVIQREGDQRLVITEIPYQVVKADLVTQIAELVSEKRIEGIRDLRDESNRKGMRIVVELKRDAQPEIVENALFKYTRLQQTFGVINLALVNGQPKVLAIKELFFQYVSHRREVITRRTVYDLNKAEQRAHILEGLLIALESIDSIVALIKQSASSEIAREQLIASFSLSEEQAKAILDMRLSKLTGLEQEGIKKEHAQLLVAIADYKDILANPVRIDAIIVDELSHLQQTYPVARRTQISDDFEDIDIEDLIESEDMVVTISNSGYVKRLPVDTYHAQHRGGKGIIGATTKEDDFIEHLFVANTHAYLLFFSNRGQVYWKKVYHIPESSRTAKGTAIINLLGIEKGESISSIIAVDSFDSIRNLVFCTKNGIVKKTSLEEYSRPRSGGIHAIKLDSDDDLVNVVLTSGSDKLIFSSSQGYSLVCEESDIRSMGRFTRGVIAMKLRSKDVLVNVSVLQEGAELLTVTENGYGKRTALTEYPLQRRGGLGVKNIQTSSRNGLVVASRVVSQTDDLLLITQKGIIIRTKASEITVIGRNTQGVRIMRLNADDSLQALARIIVEENE